MGAGQAAGDGQAQARAAGPPVAGGVEPHQPVEDAFALVVGHAGAGVGDGELARADVEGDRAAVGGVAAGVVAEVREDLRDPAGVDVDPDRSRIAGAGDREAGGQRADALGLGVGQGGEVGGPGARATPPSIRARSSMSVTSRDARAVSRTSRAGLRSVAATTTGRGGEVHGLVPADRTQVRVPPRADVDLGAYPVGTPPRVDGERYTAPDGSTHLHAATVTDTASGESVTVPAR